MAKHTWQWGWEPAHLLQAAMTLEVRKLEELTTAAMSLLELAQDRKVFLFYGPMGSGKTTFIKALCSALGSKDLVYSPSFSIAHEYTAPTGSIYHFDFYRIESEEEVFDLGYEDYFYTSNYCFIEWAEKIPSLLPPKAAYVHIYLEGNKRIMKFTLS